MTNASTMTFAPIYAPRTSSATMQGDITLFTSSPRHPRRLRFAFKLLKHVLSKPSDATETNHIRRNIT